MSPVTCPRCNSTEIIERTSRKVCANCGLIVEDSSVSEEKEWRVFDLEELQMKSRSSTSSKLRQKFAQVWDESEKRGVNIDFADRRGLRDVEKEIGRIKNKLNLSVDVCKTTKHMLLDYLERKNIRASKRTSIVAAASFLSARVTGQPKPLDLFVKKLDIGKKEVSEGYMKLRSVLPLKVDPPKPEGFLPGFVKELGLSGKCLYFARKIIKKAREERMVLGKDPSSLAAASVYLASQITGENRKREAIVGVTGSSKAIIDSRCKELEKGLGELRNLWQGKQSI